MKRLNIAKIHRAIEDAGLPVVSVEQGHSGKVQVVLKGSATKAQRQQAQALADASTPDFADRLGHATRDLDARKLAGALAILNQDPAHAEALEMVQRAGKTLLDRLNDPDAD